MKHKETLMQAFRKYHQKFWSKRIIVLRWRASKRHRLLRGWIV